ncbi:MAG TPA: hypothetical protein VER76_10160, partial [Pyrinomonadaceae bacterium]|nr:hypothetical protein [Pyrinomonadaceae bacterium]
KMAGEVARLGYRLDRASMRRKFENLIVATVRAAMAAPESENQEAALSLIELANKLSLHANLERAQEIVYDALQTDRAPGQRIRALASTLGLAPGLLHETTMAVTDIDITGADAAPRAQPALS